MKIDKPLLEIFDGKEATNAFLGDVSVFLSMKEDLKREVIQNAFLWYPKLDIDKEWNKWIEERTDEKKERLGSAIGLVLFIMKMGLSKCFTDEQFAEELKKIGFEPQLVKFFLSELGKNKEKLVQEVEANAPSVVATLIDVNWRIDIKKSSKYSRKIDEACIILRMLLSGPETDKIVFELSSGELESLVRTFSLIQKEIAEIEVD